MHQAISLLTPVNTTFLLAWGAPFSLDVTDSPDIFYYTLCTNITIYGCKDISSDPDCNFPRTCTSSVDFTGPSLNGTNRGQNKAIMDYGDPIHFTFFAVNGGGSGTQAIFSYFISKRCQVYIVLLTVTCYATFVVLSPALCILQCDKCVY